MACIIFLTAGFFAVAQNDQMQQSHIAVHPVKPNLVSEILAMETHLPLAMETEAVMQNV